MRAFKILGLAAAMAAASGAFAFVPWINPIGAATGFSWSGGGSDTGLFGSPVLVGGDTFVFFPRGFRAESINGGAPGSAYDRLEFEILANAGFSISDIRVVEFGDYGVIGQGQVSVGGTLFATDLALGAPVVSDNLVSNPGSPIFTGIGNWQANAAVNVAAINSPRFRIVLNNNLFAISDGNGSVAWIEKKVFGSAVGIQIVPGPGALALVGMGGLLAARRRRA